MNCSICLQDFVIFDYVTLFECGHYIHNLCFRRGNFERCPICRKIICEETSFCLSDKDFDIFDSGNHPIAKQLKFIQDNRTLAAIKNLLNQKTINSELVEKHSEASEKFFNENLCKFKFNILKAMVDKMPVKVIYSAHFGDTFYDVPLVFLLKGPKDAGIGYFKEVGIEPITEKIKNYFNLECVVVESDFVSRRNNILAYL